MKDPKIWKWTGRTKYVFSDLVETVGNQETRLAAAEENIQGQMLCFLKQSRKRIINLQKLFWVYMKLFHLCRFGNGRCFFG